MLKFSNYFLLHLIYFFIVILFINSSSLNEKSNIKISIIIPIYNVQDYLSECLDSIINQTYKNLEIICVNDGSTDNSLMVIKEYEKKDKRIIVISQINKGVSATKNAGMKIATGDYITFVDPDDFIDLNVFEKCIESIIKYNNPDILIYQIHFEYSKKQEILKSKIFINDSISAINEKGIFPSSCNKVFNKNLIENIYFFEKINYAEDLLFRDMVFPKASIIIIIPKISYHYRNIRVGSIENSLQVKERIKAFIEGINYLFKYYQKNNYYEFMKYILTIWIRNIHNYVKNLNKSYNKYIYSIQVLDFFDFKLKSYLKELLLKEYEKKYIYYFREIKKKGPKISVILPFYNNEKNIIKYLNNLLIQKYEDFEIICINYDNKNNSNNILNKYAEIDKRVIIFNENVTGVEKARNFGIEHAKGEYLLFLDINNFFEDNFMEELINEVDKTHPDILIYRYELFNETSNLFYTDNNSYETIWPNKYINYSSIPNKLFDVFGLYIWNKLYKRSYIQNNIFFFKNTSESTLLFIDLSIIKTNKISLLDKIIIFYNNTLSDNIESKNQKDIFSFYKYLIELKSILKKENSLDILLESYKQHVEKVCIKNIIQYKYNLYIYKQFKKGKLKKLGIEHIPNSIINLYEDNMRENIVKNSSYLFTPKISVIIPIYNSKNYLNDCLKSIINQTLKEIEIICINDGSTDNSLELINEIIGKDNRVKIINQTNQGTSEARNVGVKYAKGEFLFFIDSDDYLENNSLFELYYKANKYNLDILFFEEEQFYDDQKLNNHKKDNSLEKINNIEKIYKGIDLFIKMEKKKYNISPCLQLIKKEFYKKINFNFIQGILFEGRIMFLTLILQAERTCYINKPFYKFRKNSNSTNNSKSNIAELYSYIIIYSEIIQLIEKINLTELAKIYILKDITKLENNIIKIYSNNNNDLFKKLKEKLTINQNIQLNKILQLKTIKMLKENSKKQRKSIKIIGFIFTLLLIYIFKIKRNNK